MNVLAARMARELKLLVEEPPPGVCAWPVASKIDELTAQIRGPSGTVYESGIFTLAVSIPQRFPFEPPLIKFVTPVYHPNIDSAGRICLDLLNMPPKGAWRPSLNLSTVLASIGLLLSNPNPDDGLMSDVAAEYKLNRALFDQKARQAMHRHALPTSSGAAGMPAASAPQAAISMPDQVPDEAPSQAMPTAQAPCSTASGAAVLSPTTVNIPAATPAPQSTGGFSGMCCSDAAKGQASARSRLCLGKRKHAG